MARKRSSAKDGGGGGAFSPGGSGEGEGSTASSSSPAPGSYAQPQAATSSTTSSSKVLPSLSRPRDNDGSSSEPEHPSKKLKSSANELQGKIADDAEQSLHPDHDTQQISRSPLQDLTAIVIEGADNDGDASEIRSAFGFSPANPPAANIAWSSSNLWPSHLPPQDGLATSASAQKWKM